MLDRDARRRKRMHFSIIPVLFSSYERRAGNSDGRERAYSFVSVGRVSRLWGRGATPVASRVVRAPPYAVS